MYNARLGFAGEAYKETMSSSTIQELIANAKDAAKDASKDAANTANQTRASLRASEPSCTPKCPPKCVQEVLHTRGG